MHIFKEILGWISTLVFATAVAMFINLFIFQPNKVLGDSMEPTLNSGNIGIMSKVQHTFSIEPNYGDIVVIDSRVDHKHTLKDDLVDSFKSNIIAEKFFKQAEHIYWIKRVIGKSGDVLEFKDGKVCRNGKSLNEPYIKEPMEYSSPDKIVVPEKHVFVMGDNRNNSMDSRMIGSVPLENVIGKLAFSF